MSSQGPEPGDTESLVPMSVLRTAGLHPDRRHLAWQQHIEPFFEVTEDECFGGIDRNVSIDFGRLGDLIIAQCSAYAQPFRRPPAKVALDAHDHYIFQIFREGETRTRISGRELVARPGDVWIIDMAEDLDAFNTQFQNISIVVPRSLVQGGLRSGGGQHLRTIPAETPIAQIFTAYLGTLATGLSSMTVSDAQLLETATLRLSEALLNSGHSGVAMDVDPVTAQETLLFTARRLIEENLEDPALSPDSLAAMLGVSRASLYRIFAPFDGVSSFIRDRRLQRSVRDLLDPGLSHLRIYEIAYRWGFRSETNYSRAFQRRYDMRPGAARVLWRRAGRTCERLSPAAVDLAHQRWLRELTR